jgi:hypothetical protein
MLVADLFFTKPLQGSLFRKLRKIILNLPDEITTSQLNKSDGSKLTNAVASQECVGAKRSHANIV